MPIYSPRSAIILPPHDRPDDIDPAALNDELSQRIRGCALICELDIDEGLHDRLVRAMRVLQQRGVTDDKSRLRRYPALVATYLVSEGIFSFQQGTFFPNLKVAAPRDCLVDAFKHALAIYRGLEQFRALVDAGALRYVTPILAHGGIPRYSLSDFFEVVLDTERRGAIDAAEMIAYWREHPSMFVAADKAVERFMLYGGDISIDFLDRCLDLIRANPAGESDVPADRFGLPAYVCDAFLALDRTRRSIRGARSDGHAQAAVRPMVVLDPWDASGPMLLLPALTGSLAGATWEIIARERSASYSGSRSERVVPLAPAEYWNVLLRDSAGSTLRIFTFPGLGRSGALFFSEDGRQIADLTRLQGTCVWILRPAGAHGQIRRANGAAITPVESAPMLVGAWDGFDLAQFDLADVERLVIGDGASQPGKSSGAASALWVRVRSERIALEGEPLAGVVTDDGLPVYPAAPRLSLPGFLVGSGAAASAAWSVRIDCNGVEHSFDAQALTTIHRDVIASVVPRERVSRVQVTARGPLGMDLRTSFCIVPGLSIDRPGSVLLPSRHSETGAHVIVRSRDGFTRRVSIPTGVDSVQVTVPDGAHGSVVLHVAVPALQWAQVTGEAARSDLGQQSVRISANDVTGDTVVRLVVRTRKPGVSLVLQLRRGDAILQKSEAVTAGDDGRWAFDLRAFSGTIRQSEEPALELVLCVNGFDVRVGTIRAELEVDTLAVHQRCVGDDVTLTVTWNECRRLRHRVVRFWSVSIPWLRRFDVPVDDAADGSVTVTTAFSELPPGCYIAELVIDDGWTTLRRPDAGQRGTKLFRLGTELEEKWWVEAQPEADPLSVLAGVFITGRAPRGFNPEEVEIVTPAALDGVWVVRDEANTRARSRLAGSVTALLWNAPTAFVRGVEVSAVSWGQTHDTPFLAAALELMPWLCRSAPATVPVADTSNVWELCAPLAAVIDLPHVGNPQVQARCELGFGVSSIAEAFDREILPGTRGRMPDLQFLLARYSAEDLEAMRRASYLVPRRPLDLETQASSNFEWLIADLRRVFSASQWAATHRELTRETGELRPDLAQQLKGLLLDERFRSVCPEIYLPEVAYAAALHVVNGTRSAFRAATGLQQLVAPCPSIVTRLLVLAAVHTYIER